MLISEKHDEMKIDGCINQLINYIEKEDYAGYDPYDALNSPVVRFCSFNSKYFRIAWTQLLRRLLLNIRPLLLLKKGHNPKGVGLILGSYAKLYNKKKDPEILDKIENLLSLLESLKSKQYSGNSWGYNFDWQSRAFYVPKWTPTIVNTAFIGHALLDTYSYTGNQRALDMAQPIRDFLLNDLNRMVKDETFCFSYTPIDNLTVHNANLMGASLLIRLSTIFNDGEAKDAALKSLAFSMNSQKDDGSWFYADTKMQSWIDSFHTGYNLQAIRYFFQCGEAEYYKGAYEKGVQFYANNFFLSDGTPKYYHNNTYPIDIHSPAQAIVFFSGENKTYSSLTNSVLGWMMNNLYSQHGYFYFRKGRFLCNRISYMRWSQAWALHALSEFYLHTQ